MNITETKRGQGTFITSNEERIELLREEMKNQLAENFLTSIEALGFSKEEMLVVLKNKA